MESDQSITSEQPQSFTRGRLSRGKGLRKTTGCLNCRRRHIKCDEIRPRCGGCTRKKTRCEYGQVQGTNRRTRQQTSPITSNQENCNAEVPHDEQAASPSGAIITEEPTSLRQQQDQPRDEISVQDAHLPTDDQILPANSSQSYDTIVVEYTETIQETRNVNTQFGQVPPNSLGSHTDYGNGTYPYLDSIVYGLPSPVQLPYHPISMSYGSSPDASLTLKWLDLLVGDAAITHGPLPETNPDPDGPNIFGNSAAQSPSIAEEAGASYDNDQIGPPEPHTNGLRVETRNAYLRERIPSRENGSREKNQAWQASEPISLQTQELTLFRHFTEQISQWMDLFEPQRPFGTLVPHLALHNVGLMNAILALSARHLDILNRDMPANAAGLRPTHDETIGYYYKTLHYCQEAMQYHSYKTSLELLASAFIISAYEMLDGSNADWEKHLKGLFWIQRSQTIHGHSGGLRQAVWWAWLCQDVWAAFREKRKPFTFWMPNHHLADLTPSELAARSIYNFAHVVGFCARDDPSTIPDYMAVKMQEADRLSRLLEDWFSNLTCEFQPLPMAAPDSEKNPFPKVWIQPSSFAASMQVYYCSLILLNLHRPCSGGYQDYLSKQKTLRRWASTVCGIAKVSSDYASSVLSSQCVFIAGMVIEDPDQRSGILDILDTCSRRAGWPSYSLGCELKELWRD